MAVRVLVAEDEALIRMDLVELLGSAGTTSWDRPQTGRPQST
jgi:hypothetical protein